MELPLAVIGLSSDMSGNDKMLRDYELHLDHLTTPWDNGIIYDHCLIANLDTYDAISFRHQIPHSSPLKFLTLAP
jgi:hypothetical protein